MNYIGIIFGGSNTGTFQFASKTFVDCKYVYYFENEVNKDTLVLGEVIECLVKNNFFESPESIIYYNESIDYDRETLFIYTVRKISVLDAKKIIQKVVPALPGHKVYCADKDVVSLSYGMASDGIEIGRFKYMSECKIKISLDFLCSPHLFIAGKTGSGKSYFVKKYLSLSDEYFWIFSPTGEYNELYNSNGTVIYKDIVLKYDTDMISRYVDLNMSEEIILKKVLIAKQGILSINDIKNAIISFYSEQNDFDNVQLDFFGPRQAGKSGDYFELPRYADSLISKLNKISNIKFSNDNEYLHLPQSSCIFDLSKYSQHEQECIINSFLYRLYRSRDKKIDQNNRKIYIILEESHNYVPSVTTSMCKSIVVKLAREGRKLSISMCFITQRPRQFDQTALSQSGSKIVFSMPNSDDIMHILEDNFDKNIVSVIQNQKMGECIIECDKFQSPIECVINI